MTRPHEHGFTASGSVDHLNPMNARRLDERSLCFDPCPEYRREVRDRLEKEESDATR